jgi:hypothetical protein
MCNARVVVSCDVQEGKLYDEDFLNAPKPTLGIATVENLVKRLQDRQVEVRAADQMTRLIAPDVPGRKPDEKGVCV